MRLYKDVGTWSMSSKEGESMEDSQIVELFLKRSENAITEISSKYGKYCYAIAYNILSNAEDADESVNDAYLGAWNSLPPHRPVNLSTFLGKITRRVSLNRWRDKSRVKRGSGEIPLVFEELSECIPSVYNVEQKAEAEELTKIINNFIGTLSETERNVFVCRYWYFDPLSEICLRFRFSRSKVKSMLWRTRRKLLAVLEEEGF